jgi:hypothetical protein
MPIDDVARTDRRTVLLAAVGLAAMPIAAAQGAPEKAGEVEKVRGKASATAGSKERALAANDAVLIEDLVQTFAKSHLDLRLGVRTMLRLAENTQVKIDRYLVDAGGELSLIGGAVMFERTGEPAKDELRFRSEYGLIAVRGTRFYAGFHRGKFSVLVGTGLVQVEAGGRSVQVGPQKGTDILKPGAAPSDPADWGQPRIRDFQALFR